MIRFLFRLILLPFRLLDFLFRPLGLLLLAAGFLFLVYDGTRSIAASALAYTRFEDVWILVHAASLQRLQPVIEKSSAAWFWTPAMMKILDAPAFVVLGVVGAVLLLLARPKKPPIGYDR
jgi:hypothetical protein